MTDATASDRSASGRRPDVSRWLAALRDIPAVRPDAVRAAQVRLLRRYLQTPAAVEQTALVIDELLADERDDGAG